MKKIIILSVLMACTGACFAANWSSYVIHENRKREFKVFVPSSYAGKPLPLVIVLHGGGGGSRQIERHTGFSALAEKEGFIAAYPQGLDGQWNDGREVKQSRAHRLKIGDTGFIKKMLEAIEAKYSIDKKRVYACGISNGGFMSMRLACDMPEELAAVGVVCAGLNPFLARNAAPETKISILIMNGTDDPLVPYGGGFVKIGKKTRGEVLSTGDTLKYWLAIDGCMSKPEIYGMNPDTSDGTEVEKQDYKCGAYEVVLYKITGGGHTWPGGRQYLPESVVGKTSRDIDATQVLWNFFKNHSK
jgi:polyhydroxybutyrate depolymerase